MNAILLLLTASFLGQAPDAKPKQPPAKAASSYTKAEIYQVAKSVLAEARNRAMHGQRA